jgi:Tol biopolymer transport system component
VPLTPGTRVGVYDVTEQIGEGGMGQVFRATDTSLGRQVAIKVLPAAFAADPERTARFEREAKTLASLNHPHIAAVYGFEKSSAAMYLVMEHVDGEDLSRRIARGPIPLDEAIPIARQIAEALAAAHDQGIVHRDLKPANIKVRTDGTVKVLDFGLAKAMDPGNASRESGAGLANSPTITTPAMTAAGMIMGTAAYMSPEQAKGRIADKRSDIWSFGCVLYEMITGKKLFDAEDVSETMAAVLRADLDWQALPAGLPKSVRALIEGCLKRDRKERIGDIAVAQFLLKQTEGSPSPARAQASPAWKMIAAALALSTIAAIAVAGYVYRSRPAAEVTEFLIEPSAKNIFVTALRTGTSVQVSPDGTRLAYTARDEAAHVLIWVRPLNSLLARPLVGTDEAEFPFWSPDSKSLAYFAKGKLFKIDANGGPAQTLCNAQGARGGAWGVNSEIVFGGGTGGGLTRISTAGGDPVSITKAKEGDHRFPTFLPDGRHVLFYLQAVGAGENGGLYVAALDSGEIKLVAKSETSGVYAAPGVVLFVRGGSLVAQHFDLATLTVTGEPVLLAEHVESGVFAGVLSYSVSTTGVLAYGLGSGRSDIYALTWLDRHGKELGVVGEAQNYIGFDLSPDGKSVVVHRHEQGTGGDLWVIDIARSATSRLTFDALQDNSAPVWSADGKRVAYASLRQGRFEIVSKPTSGATTETPLLRANGSAAPGGWSPDGKYLVYEAADPAVSGGNAIDIGLVTIDGGKQTPLLTSRFEERTPRISPDGRWLAYESDETGRSEIYVRRFPSGEGKWQVSTAGGVEPTWRRDSKELFFIDRVQLGSVMAVDVHGAGDAFSAGTPQALFETNALSPGHPGVDAGLRYAVTADGQRFLVARNPRASTFFAPTSSPIAVVTNWMELLTK